jgi:hypothetical protein
MCQEIAHDMGFTLSRGKQQNIGRFQHCSTPYRLASGIRGTKVPAAFATISKSLQRKEFPMGEAGTLPTGLELMTREVAHRLGDFTRPDPQRERQALVSVRR